MRFIEGVTQECHKPIKGKQETFDTCINPEVIANILYIPKLEKVGYRVIHETKDEWVVYIPEGKISTSRATMDNVKGCPMCN